MMWLKGALMAMALLPASLCQGICAQEGMPKVSWMSEVATEAQVRAAVSASPIDAAEGVWSTTADGASVGIVGGEVPGATRSFSGSLLLVVLRSPRPAIAPGTVMGWCTPAAKAGYYDARIFTRCDGRSLSAPKRFTIHLADGAHMSFIPVRDGLEFVPWKMIPYMFRSMLRERRDRARDLDGMVRMWPTDATAPHRPRYL